VFEVIDDPQALAVVLEMAVLGHLLGQRAFAGVAKGRVAQVVGQGDRLGEVLVGPQRPGQRAGHLGHLQRVGQPRAEVVLLVRHEDLGLVVQPAERRAVDHPVAVALEARPVGVLLLRVRPRATVPLAGGLRAEPGALVLEEGVVHKDCQSQIANCKLKERNRRPFRAR
jgi:hypothetical protein